ncbi:MAG: hypothetical protein ABH800_00525 [Candidatus Nealsonbacteria bacterium]
MNEETLEEETADEEEKLKTLSPDFILSMVTIMPIAIFLDFAGLLLAIFGVSEVFSLIPDFIGLILIGGWAFFRSQSVKVTYGAEKRLTSAVKMAKRLKWLRPLLIVSEFIPFLGVAPCWILLVYFEAKS